jgi:replicative DNA helicase
MSTAEGNGYGRAQKPDSAKLSDRLPPQNIEAEEGVLGSILLDNEVLHDVVSFLSAQDFYRSSHQLIYSAIRDLYEQAKAVDAITLPDELVRRDQFNAVGGDEAIAKIIGSVPHAANAVHYAHIVRQKSIARMLIDSANQILRDCYSNNFTAEQLLETAERQVYDIAEDRMKGDTKEIKEIIAEAMERISVRAEEKHAVTGISTGYYELDDMIGGFQPQQLIVLAARPSMGKTALALNICDHVAVVDKKSVLFVSLEMGRLELVERLLCARSRVDGHKLRTGREFDSSDMKLLGNAYNELRSAPMFIDDSPSRTMLQITANARRVSLRHGLGLIMIDYIQLVESDESNDSRQEQIAKISRRLKTLARELKVPVIALSQLNRAVENRESKKPRLADLRESGAIEQDADLVLLLHRPEYYDPNDQPGIAVVDVAKNRNGRTGETRLTFLNKLTKFENLAAAVDPIEPGVF